MEKRLLYCTFELMDGCLDYFYQSTPDRADQGVSAALLPAWCGRTACCLQQAARIYGTTSGFWLRQATPHSSAPVTTLNLGAFSPGSSSSFRPAVLKSSLAR